VADINYDTVLEDIKPTEPEKKKVKDLGDKLIHIINKLAVKEGITAEAVLVGSVAKGTWLAGKADIDLFIKFPLNTEEKYLKKWGLTLGHKCIEMMNGRAEERYASHPYVTGFINGCEIDFVPCYIIADSSQLKSAVDRTIPHTEYVKRNLKPKQADEVMLLKKFMGSVGTYGSEFKVGGFSGYLCELMVLRYGSFQGVLEAVRDSWKPGCIIDLENYGTAELFDDPLIAVDPVDKNRNVAAALNLQKMSEFVVAAGNFLKNPSKEYFYPKNLKFDLVLIKEEFEKRGTKTFLLTFRPPEIPADAVYPQIKKTEKSMAQVVEREGFLVLGSDSWTDENEKAVILLELETWKLPRVKKHLGPFVWSKDHQERFLEKYDNLAWVEGDRWVVEVPRKYENAEYFLNDILAENKIGYLQFGKHLKAEILKNHEIIDMSEFLESEKCDDNILEFLYMYLNRSELLWR
jgi:tRNA nucleotidyltransferase (CCA-adding enzyme)